MMQQILRPVLAACLALAAGNAAAQGAYPARTIKIVVPFTAGGGVDTVARILGEAMRADLGQSLIVENVPGASGTRGAETVARAEPDGYTVLLASAGEVAVNPSLFKTLRYDPERDLAPVSLVVRVPNVLVISAASPLRTLDDLLALGRQDGKASFSSSGVGNPQHLAGELMNKRAGTGVMHVPYRGASQQVSDVLGNNVTATFASYLAAAPFIEAGQARALAVTSSERMPALPNVPAMAETPALTGYDVTNWFGLFAPAKTPAPIVERLSRAVNAALADPQVTRKLEALGAYPSAMTPAAFATFVRSETGKFREIVEAAGIKPQ